ncbi:amidohydrolase family protein [Ramlibacter sp. AN1015]|uniref:amidohydrolase family protein n=1 Tax=Ramlibacter sp. AN1015 TaxID=3133428 RepID=UPI0030BE7FF3
MRSLPAAQRQGDALLLARQTIPAAVLDPILRTADAAEATYDVQVRDGRIAAIAPAAAGAAPGGLLLPGLVDAHVHLDKTATFDRAAHPASGLMEAIEQIQADRVRWTDADIARRAEWGLQRAWSHGTVALRTHIDWSDAPPRSWQVIGELASDWRGRVAVQRASLTALATLADPGKGPVIAERVARDGGVLGAFIVPVAAELAQPLDAVFTLAARFDLDLDFHVDEGLDPAARGFDAVVAATARHGFAGRVTCGHGCALGTRPPEDVAAVLGRAAAGGVRLVSLPLTNLFLQDRRASATPRQRGLAPMREALAAGLPVAIASDNVGDPFHPYGDYDLLEALRVAVRVAHLDDGLADQFARITTEPAAVLRLPHGGPLRIGAPADFVRLGAASAHEWMARPGTAREVWRDGIPIDPPEPAWPERK